ncbi:RING finger protein 223 [Sardina pilchardus]|uniref:RING finger protein 223 n=1 Tax=Sardina pilchardus TaxID=27697 RepID=UPI002E12B7C5
MDYIPKVWHSQVVPLEHELEWGSGAGQPECSICYNTYDNVFKTPKQLACTHTFCLECLSRLMAATSESGDQDDGRISCPFCRHLTPVPERGPPALTTSMEVLSKLPSHQQRAEAVWLEDGRLCYKRPLDSSASLPPTTDPASGYCICIDIGAAGSKEQAPGAAVQTQTRTRRGGLLERMTDWKRLLLFVVLMVLLVVIVLWPLQCIVTTGSLRCQMRSAGHVTATTTTTTTTTTPSFTLSTTSSASTGSIFFFDK